MVLGTLSDQRPNRLPPRAGGYWILAGDFHVHAFPGDGSLAPWAVRAEAAHAGLEVIALTNHNQMLAARLARWMAASSNDPIVLGGQEITHPRYHIAAIGLERAVNADQPAASAIADVHAQGGVAIAAHPEPSFDGFDDAALARLDGTELAHPVIHVDERLRQDFHEFFERARRLNPRVARIGSSDFHASPSLGRCRTFVFARERSGSGVLEAIRGGLTVAVDADGRLQGEAALVRLLEHTAPTARRDEHAGWRRLSVALAWAGILGLVLFRR
jgi:hypothetical protein